MPYDYTLNGTRECLMPYDYTLNVS